VTVVLDAWAVLAFLNDEPAAGRVEEALLAGDARISWINLGEAYYDAIRERGEERARDALGRVRTILRAELPDQDLVLAAARLKARGGISYADCFAVATAQRHGLPLLTGDPEIIALADEVDVVDLRGQP
jgi:PIN domain nuclease of toxin-antitoxin system